MERRYHVLKRVLQVLKHSQSQLDTIATVALILEHRRIAGLQPTSSHILSD